jgi:hypothetical protein
MDAKGYAARKRINCRASMGRLYLFGVLVYEANAESETASVALPGKGICIVKDGNRAVTITN